jgi:hypothetical protein
VDGYPVGASPFLFNGERPMIATSIPQRGEHTPEHLR